MKKIYFTLFTLLTVMIVMAYLYFSNLTVQITTNDSSLNVAAANSGLVFCIRNDKDIFDIISGQDNLSELAGPEISAELKMLKNEILASPSINNLISGNNIYISFTLKKGISKDYLISTQLNDEHEKTILMKALRSNKIRIDSTSNGLKLVLKDSTAFYLGIEKNLVVLSSNNKLVEAALKFTTSKDLEEFVSYIKSGDKLRKNSLANLYVDFNRFPANKQNAYAALNYNFSKERLLFNGSSIVNDSNNYLYLFSGLTAQKNDIDHILPDNTVSFVLYTIPDYLSWHKSLNNWFVSKKEDHNIQKITTKINEKYRLDLETIFPEYFKNQLITFELNSTEKLGAIQLSNGDKINQLLIELSENYSQDIKQFKESDLLYCYFGEPFKKFRKPYYTIIDNYLVFSNYASTVQSFLNNYHKNNLLINTPAYTNLYNQISDDANITYYKKEKDKNSMIYQLSGDKGSFQTNFLINPPQKIVADTIGMPTDTIKIVNE